MAEDPLPAASTVNVTWLTTETFFLSALPLLSEILSSILNNVSCS